ncbi:hypothetical protein IAR50_004652 [Cryptococcus sp. DSM 104548]
MGMFIPKALVYDHDIVEAAKSTTRRVPKVATTIDLFRETQGNEVRVIQDFGLTYRLRSALKEHVPANALVLASVCYDPHVQ